MENEIGIVIFNRTINKQNKFDFSYLTENFELLKIVILDFIRQSMLFKPSLKLGLLFSDGIHHSDTLENFSEFTLACPIELLKFNNLVESIYNTEFSTGSNDWKLAIIIALYKLIDMNPAPKTQSSIFYFTSLENSYLNAKDFHLIADQLLANKIVLKLFFISTNQDLLQQCNSYNIKSLSACNNTFISIINPKHDHNPIILQPGISFSSHRKHNCLVIGKHLKIPIQISPITTNTLGIKSFGIRQELSRKCLGKIIRSLSFIGNKADIKYSYSYPVKSFEYGGMMIPSKEADRLENTSELPCLKLICTISLSQLKRELVLDKASYVHPLFGDSFSEHMIKSIVTSLKQTQGAIICRYIWRRNSHPRQVALFPHPDHASNHSLVMVYLPFNEDFRPYYSFSLPQITSEQLEETKKIIKTMTLKPEKLNYSVYSYGASDFPLRSSTFNLQLFKYLRQNYIGNAK